MEILDSQYIFRTIVALLAIFVLDVLIYGEMFPILGLLMGSYFCSRFQLTFLAQVFLVGGFTMLIFFLSLALKIEKVFWKKLYSLENFYKYVLHIRDIVNGILLCIYIASLINISTIFNVISYGDGTTNSDAGGGSVFPSPGQSQNQNPGRIPVQVKGQISLSPSVTSASSVTNTVEDSESEYATRTPLTWILHMVCQRIEFYKVHNFVKFCIPLSLSSPLSHKTFHEICILHAVSYIVVAVAKMLYYNTLFTYLQTLRMFRDLQQSLRPNGRGHGTGKRSRNEKNHTQPAEPATTLLPPKTEPALQQLQQPLLQSQPNPPTPSIQTDTLLSSAVAAPAPRSLPPQAQAPQTYTQSQRQSSNTPARQLPSRKIQLSGVNLRENQNNERRK